MEQAPRCAFVIFGMTGDLTARKLMPALYQLHIGGALHPEAAIVGFARSDLDDDGLRSKMKEALNEYVDDFDEAKWDELSPRLSYVDAESYEGADDFEKLKKHLDDLEQENRVFYTATPPGAYEGIVGCLSNAGLNKSDGWVRLVVEKPFGNDLESAQKLNEHVLEHFKETQVYRIDHYLAKETAQNLSALRFANTLFEPVWSNQYLDHVQITMMEPMGVEGRGSFYEEAGVIRDVFQNHLLQLVALVAMEPPARWDAVSVRDEKVKVFRAMACIEPDNAVLGQYTADGDAPGYRDEDGVDADSNQATYAAASFSIHNWRWEGVPFYVRSGKRLEGKASEIVLRFKKPPHIPFDLDSSPKADRLVLRLVPNEGISLRFNAKEPGQGEEMERVSMNFYYDQEFDRANPDAYETLLLDVMLGDATLFMRADEVEGQWRVVQPLLEYWDGGDKEPVFYKAGSAGPEEANKLLERDGRYWHKPGSGKVEEKEVATAAD